MSFLLFMLKGVLRPWHRLLCRSSRDDIRVNVLRCEHRMFLNVDNYWLGLDIVQSSTAWYDGNPSTYRTNWRDPSHTCFLISRRILHNRRCGVAAHYICKKAAGSVPVTVVYANSKLMVVIHKSVTSGQCITRSI